MERVTRIELALSAWEADVLPLNYTRERPIWPSACRIPAVAADDDPLVPMFVTQAFGLTGRPRALAGGTGRSVRVGDVVLKPVDDPAEAIWLAELQHDLHSDNVRTPRPRHSKDGRWIVDGWTASSYLPGSEQRDRWAETIAAGRHLHSALADVPRPDLVDARIHRWAVADRLAWGVTDSDLAERLTAMREPLDLPSQLVHCDLSGNVLFHDGEPPAVIDLSLYRRPVPYAEAIVAVDAFLWYEAGPGVLDLIEHPDARQLLIRAALFRWACELDPDPTALASYEQLTDLIEQR